MFLRKGTVPILLLCGAFALFAGDAESRTAYAKGRTFEKTKKYTDAAKSYLNARIEADDPVLKANALQAAAKAWRKAGKYGEEFDCLQTLVKRHLSRIDFTKVIQRQYEIGDEYFKGHRDVILPWLPFIKRDDRTIEIYASALKNAPCAEPAARTRLRLGRIYTDKEEYPKAVREYSEAVKLDTDSRVTRNAALELSNVFRHLSSRGDGDGKNAELALEAFDKFIERYPNAPEIPWVIRSRREVRENLAKRFRAVGDFYYKAGKNDVAERYFATIVKDYPETGEGANAEKMLSKIDSEYRAKGIPVKPMEQRVFKIMPFPEEESPILMTPLESGNRWLLPVRDVRTGEDEKQDVKPEITDDML